MQNYLFYLFEEQSAEQFGLHLSLESPSHFMTTPGPMSMRESSRSLVQNCRYSTLCSIGTQSQVLPLDSSRISSSHHFKAFSNVSRRSLTWCEKKDLQHTLHKLKCQNEVILTACIFHDSPERKPCRDGRIRTCGQVLRRHLLYPLSYAPGKTPHPALTDTRVRVPPCSRMCPHGKRTRFC